MAGEAKQLTPTMKTYQIWVARCGHGAECKKNNRILYKKQSFEEAQNTLARHYYDKDQHKNMGSWEECLQKAADGVKLEEREYEVWVDEEGNEHDKPVDEEEQPEEPETHDDGKGKGKDKKGKGKKGDGKGKKGSKRDRDWYNEGSMLAVRGQNTVQLSATELDEIMDSLQRASTAAMHTASICERAGAAFKAESQTLDACRFAFQKFRRTL